MAKWILATCVGAALVVFLPDNLLGEGTLIRLSDRHGPTAADALGLAIAMAGWAIYLRALWLVRRRFQQVWASRLLVAITFLSTFGCVLAAAGNLDFLLIVFAIVAFAAQVGLGLLPFSVDGGEPRARRSKPNPSRN
jgi:hypothetical protein